MNKQLTLQDVLLQLRDEGYKLPEGYESTIPALVSEDEVTESPWYVRFFVGLSAWIAALLFIAFLFVANLLNEGDAFIVGLVFCTIAVGANRLAPRTPFLGQLGLALSMAGQLLFLVGLNLLLGYKLIPIAVYTIILEMFLLCLYNTKLHRVISTLAILGGLLSILQEMGIFEEGIQILIFLLGAGLVALHYDENYMTVEGLDDLIRPINIGFAVFLLGLLIMPLIDYFAVYWWVTAVLLTAVLLFLVLLLAQDLGLNLRSGVVPWLLVGCFVLLVPASRMPGILGALIVLLLGFWRNNRLLTGLAIVFLLFYLGGLYFSLEWTLLVKSFALMGTGAIMFLLRYLLQRSARGGIP